MSLHRNCGRPARAVSLGILTTAFVVTAAQAAESTAPFVFVAYSNRTGGEQLASGDFLSASHDVYGQTASAAVRDPQALDTNRCVAYTMTKQISRARLACDAAVDDARRGDATILSWSPQAPKQNAAAAAVAYSNRAVLHWVDADPKAAEEDLMKAQALAPQASFVTRNMSALHTHQSVALKTTATAQLTPPAQE